MGHEVTDAAEHESSSVKATGGGHDMSLGEIHRPRRFRMIMFDWRSGHFSGRGRLVAGRVSLEGLYGLMNAHCDGVRAGAPARCGRPARELTLPA